MEGAFDDSIPAAFPPTGRRGIAIAIFSFSFGNGGRGECIYFEITLEDESGLLDASPGAVGRAFEKRDRPRPGVLGNVENITT
jgi:hypothetical protein